MSRPASLPWFAAHELRLFWRDWISFRSGGKRSREPIVVAIAAIVIGLIHLLAFAIVSPLVARGITIDKIALVTISGSALMAWALMLSQAIESVTRAFYARADLDLILSSPASARRVFTIRMCAVVIASTLLTTALVAPFLNMLAVLDGAKWLAGYGMLCAMGALSTATAIIVSGALFRSIGPRRTRLVSQVVSAVIAATFVVGVQVAAIISTGTISRLSLFRSQEFIASAPNLDSLFWIPARAAMGDLPCLAIVLALSLAMLVVVVWTYSARFADLAATTAGVHDFGRRGHRHFNGFRQCSGKRVLRRNDWMLVRRDPWLMSQTLMQILYLLPPFLIIWLSLGDRAVSLLMVVPILVMASGQLAGGLSWLVVSGEDAPDLVESAPVSARAVVTAKIEFVLGAVAVVVAPLVIALALVAPTFALCTLLGGAVAAVSGMMIQFWFRDLAPPRSMRRRQTPSRLATLAEAVSAMLWAGTATLVAAGSWLAMATGLIAILALLGIRTLRPQQENLV